MTTSVINHRPHPPTRSARESALEGTATHAYAVSFIVTNIPANDRPGDTTGNAETILEVEASFAAAPISRTESARPSSAPHSASSPLAIRA